MAVGPLICFVAYIRLLQPHSDDMSRVVDQLLKLIATFIGLSRLSRSRIICCINVFTSLLGLVIVSHLSPRGLGRFSYILYPENYPEHKIRKIHARKSHTISHYMYSNEASRSRHSTHIKMPKKKIVNASNEHSISFKTFDASFVLTNKSGKIVAKYVGGKHKSPKTCVWVPKVLVSNVK
jgi:hypothetical protein